MAGLPANISYHSTYITLELCWLMIDLYVAYILSRSTFQFNYHKSKNSETEVNQFSSMAIGYGLLSL